MTRRKKKTYKDVAVDGDTLEKRREQRAEQLEKYIHERPEQGPGILNAVTQWEQGVGAKVVPASQSLFDLEAEEKKLRDVSIEHEFTDLPPIVKRTPEERVESMTKRLIEGGVSETILKEIAGEYWKAGMPVAVEDLRRVAAHFLNQAERKKNAS